MPTRILPMYVTSQGTGITSDDTGTSIRQDISPTILIPDGAQLKIYSASFWWVDPNVTDEFANRRFIFTSATLGTFNYLLPEGLYDLVTLFDVLNKEATNSGWNTVANGAFWKVSENNATGHVFIRTAETVTINWNSGVGFNNTFDLLGYDAGTTTVFTAGINFYSPNDAKFNINANTLLLHCSAVDGVIYDGNGSSDICLSVVPAVLPGQQNPWEGNWPSVSNANQTAFNSINWYWTNENGRPINMKNNEWHVYGNFEWEE